MGNEDLRKRIKELERTLENHEKRLSKLEEQRKKIKSKKEEKHLTLTEFLKGKNIEYHKDKTLRIGYFLDTIKKQDAFTSKDIEERYKECRFNLPANISDILNKMSQEDLIMELDEKEGMKQWQLTKAGIILVEKEIENE